MNFLCYRSLYFKSSFLFICFSTFFDNFVNIIISCLILLYFSLYFCGKNSLKSVFHIIILLCFSFFFHRVRKSGNVIKSPFSKVFFTLFYRGKRKRTPFVFHFSTFFFFHVVCIHTFSLWTNVEKS